MIDAAFASATSYVREHIVAEGIDVVFVDAPNDAIPEWALEAQHSTRISF